MGVGRGRRKRLRSSTVLFPGDNGVCGRYSATVPPATPTTWPPPIQRLGARTETTRAALQPSGVDRKRVGYINAHGTSTPLGDERAPRRTPRRLRRARVRTRRLLDEIDDGPSARGRRRRRGDHAASATTTASFHPRSTTATHRLAIWTTSQRQARMDISATALPNAIGPRWP